MSATDFVGFLLFIVGMYCAVCIAIELHEFYKK